MHIYTEKYDRENRIDCDHCGKPMAVGIVICESSHADTPDLEPTANIIIHKRCLKVVAKQLREFEENDGIRQESKGDQGD